ncbi:MAG: hypothetical protein U0325_21560 [Polyangiales bacterium]
MRALRFFLITTALSLPAAAQQPPNRDALIGALSGFESQPGEAEVRGWGAGAVPVLASVIDDADVMVAARARAAFALRVFVHEPAALALLQRLVAQADGNLFVRLAAMDALAEGGAPLAPVTAQLASPDTDLRAGAAASLSRARNLPAARAALTARLRVEQDPAVRLRLDQSLRRISTPAR